MKGAKLPTPARKIVPYGDWQFAASFYEIFPAPCLSAGAALEKSAFPTYRFFLIWLIALFIVPYGDWQFAASFYEIFPAPCLSAGAALEKSAFPTYRFFLIWLIALFLPSAHAADGARILFFPGGSKFRRGKFYSSPAEVNSAGARFCFAKRLRAAPAALEKSAFPTYRFFLIWLIALFSRRETWA